MILFYGDGDQARERFQARRNATLKSGTYEHLASCVVVLARFERRLSTRGRRLVMTGDIRTDTLCIKLQYRFRFQRRCHMSTHVLTCTQDSGLRRIGVGVGVGVAQTDIGPNSISSQINNNSHNSLTTHQFQGLATTINLLASNMGQFQVLCLGYQ